MPFRAAAYADLDLTPSKEDSMVLWNPVPHRSSEVWWAKYRKAKDEKSFGTWHVTLGKSSGTNLVTETI